MSDVWRRNEPASPCVRICMMHPTGVCVGCLRTIDEISAWTTMAPDERRAVLDALPLRAPMIARRRGGRSRTR